jgi:hypothetical protein
VKLSDRKGEGEINFLSRRPQKSLTQRANVETNNIVRFVLLFNLISTSDIFTFSVEGGKISTAIPMWLG